MTNLIVISHESDIENEISLVNELFHNGMQLFHLRKPLWDIDYQRYFLNNINSEFRDKISVHQHHETISEFGMNFFHVKENNRKQLRKMKGLTYSTSFHDIDTLEKEYSDFNYCFLSPIFDSISKTDYKGAFSGNLILPSHANRVFALGGISIDNIDSVFEKGFYGAAVLGSVWKDKNKVIQNFKIINEACKKNVHTF